MNIYFLLFYEFMKVGFVCVGGGYASMPLIQASIVDTYHWLELSEFIDIFTISQMTPGPIGVNAATFAGMKIAGIGGSIAATLGFAFPSLVMGICLAKIFFKYGNLSSITGILNGLRPAVIALIAIASLSFMNLALFEKNAPVSFGSLDVKGLAIFLVALFLTRKKIGAIRVLLLSGVLGLLVGWFA